MYVYFYESSPISNYRGENGPCYVYNSVFHKNVRFYSTFYFKVVLSYYVNIKGSVFSKIVC